MNLIETIKAIEERHLQVKKDLIKKCQTKPQEEKGLVGPETGNENGFQNFFDQIAENDEKISRGLRANLSILDDYWEENPFLKEL